MLFVTKSTYTPSGIFSLNFFFGWQKIIFVTGCFGIRNLYVIYLLKCHCSHDRDFFKVPFFSYWFINNLVENKIAAHCLLKVVIVTCETFEFLIHVSDVVSFNHSYVLVYPLSIIFHLKVLKSHKREGRARHDFACNRRCFSVILKDPGSSNFKKLVSMFRVKKGGISNEVVYVYCSPWKGQPPAPYPLHIHICNKKELIISTKFLYKYLCSS